MSVKIARIKKGLTQQQLIEKLKVEYSIGISPSTLVAIEKGNYKKVKFGTLIAIAAVLESTFEKLFLKN